MLAQGVHGFGHAHAFDDGAELVFAEFGPGGAVGWGGGEIVVAPVGHDVGDPGAEGEAAGEAELAEGGEAFVFGDGGGGAGFLGAVVAFQREVFDVASEGEGAVEGAGSFGFGELEAGEVGVHVDVEDGDLRLFEELPDHGADGEGGGAVAGGDVDLMAEALAEEGVGEGFEEDGSGSGGVVDGGRGERRCTGVGPDEALRVEAAGFFGHELGVGERPGVIAAGGLDAVGFDGADGDEDDVGTFELFGHLDLAEAGEIARVELTDLGAGGDQKR